MNKKVRGIGGPGVLPGEVKKSCGPMKSVSMKPTKTLFTTTSRGGGHGASASTKDNGRSGY